MSKEAMKLALEAMQYADACLKKQLTTKTKHEYAQDLLLEAGKALEEALAEIKAGGGEIYASEVEVTDLGKPEFLNETTLDDFGDFVPAQQRTWVGLTDEEIDAEADKEEQAYGFIQGVAWAEAKLKEKNT